MERDERLRADDLNRYWDAVLRGSPPSAPPDSVPDLADLVNRLHVSHGPSPSLFPDPHRTWRELRSTPVLEALPWPHPNGREQDPPGGWTSKLPARPSPAWMAAQLATAAVLLLTLVGYVLIQQQSRTSNEAAWTPAFVNALASVSGEVVDQALVDAIFSPEEIPAGETEAVYYRLSIQPGAEFSSLAAPTWCECREDLVGDGVGVEVVRSGAYSMRLDIPIRVQRNGVGEITTVPAETEVTLSPGDAVIIPDYAAKGEIRSTGAEPATVVGLTIFSSEKSGNPAPPRPEGISLGFLSHATTHDWERLPAGPLRVSMRQVTLPAEAVIGPYSPAGLEAMLIEGGRIYRSFIAKGETAPATRPIYRGKGEVIPFVGVKSGSVNQIGVGDDPAELLVVFIEPAGISLQAVVP